MKIILDQGNNPVFINGTGEVLTGQEGTKQLRKLKGWSTTELANHLGLAKRTIDGYEQGRKVSKIALLLMMRLIEE